MPRRLGRLTSCFVLNAISDCADRECIGFNVRQPDDIIDAAYALEEELINRFDMLPTADTGNLLRTGNALAYASELYRKLAEIVRPSSRIYPTASAGAKRRSRMIHEIMQARTRMATSFQDVRGIKSHHRRVDPQL